MNDFDLAIEMLKNERFDDIFISDYDEVSTSKPFFELKLTGVSTHQTIPERISKLLLPPLRQLCQRTRQSNREINRESLVSVIDFYALRFRMSYLESVEGMVYVLHRLPDAVPGLNEIGVEKWIKSRVTQPELKGLIIISGASNSGKTTTASAIVKNILEEQGGLCVTLEDPCEMPLHGTHNKGRCIQIPFNHGHLDVLSKIALRWNPDVLFYGEINDTSSAMDALRAAMNGHLVLCTLQAESLTKALEYLRSMLVLGDLTQDEAHFMLSSGLAAVVHQEPVEVMGKRRINREFLWAYESEGVSSVRSIIMTGKFDMIAPEVKAQASRFNTGRSI